MHVAQLLFGTPILFCCMYSYDHGRVSTLGLFYSGECRFRHVSILKDLLTCLQPAPLPTPIGIQSAVGSEQLMVQHDFKRTSGEVCADTAPHVA